MNNYISTFLGMWASMFFGVFLGTLIEDKIKKDTIEMAIKTCESNGGLESISKYEVICNNKVILYYGKNHD